MNDASTPPPWADADWAASVAGWVATHLAARGLTLTGPMEPRLRPWSAVLAVPTSGGRCWFKTTAQGMANDAGLTPLLAAVAPGLVLEPIAVDPDRRWMLLPDGGDRLRDHVEPARSLGHWERILPAYASLQLAVEPRAADLLSAGALDRRPDQLAGLLAELLDEPEWLQPGEPEGLTPGELARVRDLVPRLAEAGDALASVGIGPSIQHDDLHDGNVVVSGSGHRIVDWGDASLAHPFGSLLVTLNSVADGLGLADDAPQLARLADAYLEPFTARAPRSRLRSLVPLARWTAMVGRALTWRAALPHATDDERREWGPAIPGWLRELIAAAPPPARS